VAAACAGCGTRIPKEEDLIMDCSLANPAARRSPRLLACLTLLLVASLSTSCATVYNGQAAVPGTNQRLLVGHDGWPNRKVWVLEDGKVHSVKVVHAPKEAR
jgi:hypothetical protein